VSRSIWGYNMRLVWGIHDLYVVQLSGVVIWDGMGWDGVDRSIDRLMYGKIR
jgi:hypothetical protein